jgi:hypothetical protein
MTKMLQVLKPPYLSIFDIFAKVCRRRSASSKMLTQDAHREHLRLSLYRYERKKRERDPRCSPTDGLRARVAEAMPSAFGGPITAVRTRL